MHLDRDTTRIVRSWLEEGRTTLPDHVLDAVLDRVPATRQSRSSWRVRRLDEIRRPAAMAIVAAAVVVAVIGISLATREPSIGPVRPSASPSPSPAASPGTSVAPSPAVPGSLFHVAGPLQTGRLGGTFADLDLVLTVPGPGWESDGVRQMSKGGPDAPDGASVAFWAVANVYSDPCLHWLLDPPTDASAAELATSLGQLPRGGSDRRTPVAISIGGREGRFVEIIVRTGLCDNGTDDWAVGLAALWIDVNGDTLTLVPGQHLRSWFVDIDGTRLVIVGTTYPDTSPAAWSEIRQIVESIAFP